MASDLSTLVATFSQRVVRHLQREDSLTRDDEADIA